MSRDINSLCTCHDNMVSFGKEALRAILKNLKYTKYLTILDLISKLAMQVKLDEEMKKSKYRSIIPILVRREGQSLWTFIIIVTLSGYLDLQSFTKHSN